MGETFKIVFLLFLSLSLIVYGSIAIKQKRVSIGFGRGTRPLFTIPLAGTRAILFGVTGILGGIITLIPTIMFLSSRDSNTLETAMTVGIATALIVIWGGLGVGAISQFFKTSQRSSGVDAKED
jgi:hypothetical protein